MIQEVPICFDCERRIESVSDAVFANPARDELDAPSAIFHPLCLMRWRERREEAMKRFRAAHEAFLRHVNGECSCSDDGPL